MLKQDLLMEFPDRAALDKYLVNEPYGTEVVNMNYNRGAAVFADVCRSCRLFCFMILDQICTEYKLTSRLA